MDEEAPDLRLRRSLGPAGSRRRRALHYTRGFLRPIVLGGFVGFLIPASFAATVWSSYEDLPRYARAFAYVDVAAAVLGGALAARLLPAHPVASEGSKNAAIAAVGAVGAAYGIAWLLAKAGLLGFGRFLPVEPGALAHEMVRFLVLGAALAGALGAVIGHRRARSALDEDASGP